MGYFMKYKGKIASGRVLYNVLAPDCRLHVLQRKQRIGVYIQKEPIASEVLCNKKTCARRKFRLRLVLRDLSLGFSARLHGGEVV